MKKLLQQTTTTPHLVNGTWNQALDVLSLPKDHWEGGAKGRGSLNRGETNLSNVVCVLEAKYCSGLIGRHTLVNAEDLAIEVRLRATR